VRWGVVVESANVSDLEYIPIRRLRLSSPEGSRIVDDYANHLAGSRASPVPDGENTRTYGA